MKKKNIYIEPEKKLKIYGNYDVVVIGGGCAGLSSAIASARNGAKTIIIERFPFFGGTATASLMGNINGFRNQVEPDGLQTTKGIGEEFILDLIKIEGIGRVPSVYKSKIYPNTKGLLSYSFAVDTEKLKYIMLKKVVDAGVDILFHTYFSDIIKEKKSVMGVIFENKSGRQVVFGKVIIDASGDGDVAFKSGVPFWQVIKKEEYRLTDCLMYKVTEFPMNHNIKGCESNRNLVLWGPDPGPIDATNAVDLTNGEIKARLGVYTDFEEKKKKYTDLKHARIIETGVLAQ